jgi:hypothetical protein
MQRLCNSCQENFEDFTGSLYCHHCKVAMQELNRFLADRCSETMPSRWPEEDNEHGKCSKHYGLHRQLQSCEDWRLQWEES